MLMNTIKYRGQTTTGRSPDLWHDCPILGILEDPTIGYGFFDDFLNVPTVATTVNAGEHGYVFLDASSTVTQSTGEVGGAVQIFTTADNEEASLQRGFVGAPFIIPATSVTGKKLWFEARVKVLLTTVAKGGFFVGLAEEGSAAADFMGDGGAITDFANKDYLGFWRDEDALTLAAIVDKTGGTDSSVAAAIHTIEADTYVKLGFKYDPGAPSAKRIKFYVDGVEQSSYIGEVAADSTIYIRDTTNFPGGQELSPIIHAKGAHADDFTLTMDWWSCYQLR